MAITRPTGEQLRFRSQYTGDHVLDTYLESAEKGGRSIPDLLDDLFDGSGVFRDENFEFRFDPTVDKLQFRVGNFASSTTGWVDLTTFFDITGTFNAATTYKNFDLVTLTDKDVYIVHGLSSPTTFSTEAAFEASSYTTKLVDVSEAREWASQTTGIVRSTDYSAKAWAIGGTDVTTTANRGPAKDWAIKVDGAVDTAEYSSKAWAIGGTGVNNTASRGSSKEWATKITGSVDTAEFSSKAWAIGGTSVTNTANRGASKEWATKTTSNVDGTEFSAKEYAQGTQVSTGGSAKSWAVEASGISGGSANDRSAKDWAQGANMTGATLQGSAKDWAQYTGGTVDGTNYSAKYWATYPDVTTIVTNVADVNTVAGSIASVNTNATYIANINANATNIADINTVAAEINNNNLQTVAADIQAVIDVANDLNEATSEIDTVANSITNVDIVGTNITDVNTVAADISNVNTVATDIANVNTTAGSIANVNTTATDIANVNTTATNIADVNTVATDITNVNTVATDIASVNYVAGIRNEVVELADQYHVGTGAPASPSEGDMWYKTDENKLFTYDGSQWQETTNFNKLLLTDYKFTIASDTTTISGTDDNLVTLSFDGSATERVDVFLNGILLDVDDDYTINYSTNVLTLNDTAIATDVIVIRKFLTATATELGVLASDLEGTNDWRKEAESWATTTGGVTQSYSAGVPSNNTDYSSKEWAIGTTVPTGSAKDWANETGAQVDGAEYSSKEWAIGTTTPDGSAKDWATETGAQVDGSEYSAKEYAVGTFIPTGSAKDWATETGAFVDGSGVSAKEWSIGTFVPSGSAKDWATETGAQVDGSEYSAKEWAIGTVVPSGSAKDWSITPQNTTVDGVDYSAMHWAMTAADTYDAFDDRYLGSKASEPTVDNDGDALQTGALFWDTTASQLKVYNGSLWEAIENQALVGITDTATTSQVTITDTQTTVAQNTHFDGMISIANDVYLNNYAIISNDADGEFADRTGTNIDHIWHSDSAELGGTGTWNFCSDNAYKANGNSMLRAAGLIAPGTSDGANKAAFVQHTNGGGGFLIVATNDGGTLEQTVTSPGTLALKRETVAGGADPYISFHAEDGSRKGFLQINDSDQLILRSDQTGTPTRFMFGSDSAQAILQAGFDATSARLKLQTGSNTNGTCVSSDDFMAYDNIIAGQTRLDDDTAWFYNTGENGLFAYSGASGNAASTTASDCYSYLHSRTVADSSDALAIFVDGNIKVEIDPTGQAYTDGAWNNVAADYAEMFEWADGNPDNEDRVGYSVVLDETDPTKIRKATSADPAASIIGIISAAPGVLGDNAWNNWHAYRNKDDWGRDIKYDVPMAKWTNDTGIERRMRLDKGADTSHIPADAEYFTTQEAEYNPDWDRTAEYTPRQQRKEWDAVGLLGKLRMHAGQPVGDRWFKQKVIKFDTDGTTPLIEQWLVR